MKTFKRKKLLLRGLSVLLAGTGLFLLGYVLLPIMAYEVKATKDINAYLSPVPKGNEALMARIAGAASQGTLDYTKPDNWFVGAEEIDSETPNIRFYTLSIPKLKIKDATVEINGEDLSKSLIHYGGTALPGKRGNAAIFGHSILPQFFDPTNYMSIFSTIPTLNKGDEIYAQYDGITYRYIVEDSFEVMPTDIQILEQNPSDSFITLITCVPPGHPLRPKRLIVRARIAPNL